VLTGLASTVNFAFAITERGANRDGMLNQSNDCKETTMDTKLIELGLVSEETKGSPPHSVGVQPHEATRPKSWT